MQTRLIAAAAAIVALGAMAQAQQLQPLAPAPDFDKVTIKPVDLGNRIYMLQGEGGNITVAIADDGVIMVDSQFAPLYGKIKAAIARLTPLPIRYLIITHFHRDHTGGAEAFGRDGAIIVAHENVKTRMASGTRNGLTGNLVPAAPAIALPKETYQDTMTVRLQGRSAELRYSRDVHTDGDTYVYFADANVLVTGDIVFFGRYPEHRFRLWGQHRWHDPRRRRIARFCQGGRHHRAGARPGRQQDDDAGVSRDVGGDARSHPEIEGGGQDRG